MWLAQNIETLESYEFLFNSNEGLMIQLQNGLTKVDAHYYRFIYLNIFKR